MRTGWLPSLFPDRGRVFISAITSRPPMGAPPSLQSKGYCDWRNRKLNLTTHLHARQHLNMHKILPQYSYKCPWQPFLLHSLLYLQNNTANYETLLATRLERTLLKTFLKLNQLDALISQINFWNKTVHVSHSSPVHHYLVLSWSCSQAVSKPVRQTSIPLLCLRWKTPDGGHRNCPKHLEFYS